MRAGNATAIAGGAEHSLVLKNNGDVWITGSNTYGELGDGTSVDKNRFVFVIGTWAIALGNILPTRARLPTHLQQTPALDG